VGEARGVPAADDAMEDTGVTLEEGSVNFVAVLKQGDCIHNAGPQFTHSQKSERLHMTRDPCQELAEYFRRQLVAHYESYQFGTFFAMLRPPSPDDPDHTPLN
jgi:hypothetical protein